MTDAGRGLSGAEGRVVARAVDDASVDGFRAGMVTAALLTMLGGAVSAAGIRNPRRRVEALECPGGAMVGASERLGRGQAPALPAPASPAVSRG